MNDIRTFKLKLLGDFNLLDSKCSNYLKAINWLSPIVFELGKNSIPNPNKLSKLYYPIIREKFGLSSQLTQSLFRHIVSSYRSIKSNKNWSLAVYKKPSIPICWKRDFNLSKKGLTIWNSTFNYKGRSLPEGKWSDSKLKKARGEWYLCLTIKINTPEFKEQGSILGADSGINNIVVAISSSSNKTFYYSGRKYNYKRQKIRELKAKVTSVGTRSAKRLLKRLAHREQAITQNELHLASKKLVAFAKEQNVRLIVFENLSKVRNSSNKKGKVINAQINRWPFRLMQFFTSYKAKDEGIETDYINPYLTSQACSRCGHTEKSNRNKSKFLCKKCNYSDNADRNAAINIGLKTILQRQAVGGRAAVNQLIVPASLEQA